MIFGIYIYVWVTYNFDTVEKNHVHSSYLTYYLRFDPVMQCPPHGI